MTTVLVTGGAGFIGYHLTKYLLARGLKVVIFDNFSSYYSPQLKKINALECQKLGAKIIEGDILNRQMLFQTIENEQCSKIVHLAAQPGVRYSSIHPEKTLRVNVEGTANILEAVQKLDIQRVILTSSSSVFGSVFYLPINENHPKKPVSIYGTSKLMVEQMAEVYRYLYPNLDIVIIRPFTVVGARQRPDMAINKFVSCALEEKKITVFGDGWQTRDWTHVENIAQGFYLALTKEKARNQTFNIGNGSRISVNEVLKLIAKITNRELRLIFSPRNKADTKDTFADISKAKQLIGYHPQKTIFDAIEDFTEFYLAEKFGKGFENISRKVLFESKIIATKS
ncbi:MAG: NAD-dependent epimerase/dehydratase family protein [Candidatus Heimdallarchaeota archaeon]